MTNNMLPVARPVGVQTAANAPGYSTAPGYAQFERLTDTRKRLDDAIAFLAMKLSPVTAQRPEPDASSDMQPSISMLESEVNFLQALINQLSRLTDSVVL